VSSPNIIVDDSGVVQSAIISQQTANMQYYAVRFIFSRVEPREQLFQKSDYVTALQRARKPGTTTQYSARK